MKADGTVYINTEIDISGFQKGSHDLEAAAKRMAATVEKIGKGLGESIGQTISAPESGIEQMTDDAKQLSDALDKAAEKKESLAKQPITESIDTSVNIGGFQSGSKELESAARDMISTAEGLGKDIEIAVQKRVNAFVKENQAISAQQQKVKDLQQQIAELSGKRVETDAFKAINADVEKLEKSLDAAIEKQIRFRETGGSLQSRTFQAMEYDIQNITDKLNAAKEQKNELLSSGGAYTQADTSGLTNQLSAETKRLENMNNQLSTSYADLQQRLKKYQDQLQETKNEQDNTGKSTVNLSSKTSSFGKRLSRLISGALVFNVISSGLRSMTNYMGKALKSNDSYASSLAQLKAAFMTAFQPIYELAVPALTTLMRIMTAAITIIGQFFAAISGKSYAQMKDNAKAINNQAKAIGGVGSAAKEANKFLAPFDELITVDDQKETGGGGGGTAAEIAPDFSWTDEFSDKIKKIAEDVLLVGIGFSLWKISDSLPGKLGDILGKIGLIVIAIGFLKLAWDGFMDAWENGIDWSNLTQILIGVAGAAIALGIAFGPIAAGIVLLAGGIALVVLALREYNKTGELSKKACDALMAGIVGICLAIGILTGAWIPLLIAGILYLAYKLADFLGYGELFRDGIGDIFGGVVDIFKSVFAFDLPGILDGFERGFNGFNDALTAIVASIIDGIITLINKTFGTEFKTLKEQGRGDGSSVNEKQHGGGGGTFGDKEAKTEFSNFSKSIADLINQNTATKDTLDRLNESENKLSQALSEMNTYTFAGGNMQSLLSSGYQVPYLATGAVIPPSATYSAEAANQEVVKSIDLLTDIFKQSANEESVGNSRVESLLIELINAVSNIRIGDDTIGRAYDRYNRKTSRARGW